MTKQAVDKYIKVSNKKWTKELRPKVTLDKRDNKDIHA
jgi:hypothetical protein